MVVFFNHLEVICFIGLALRFTRITIIHVLLRYVSLEVTRIRRLQLTRM